MIRLTFALSAAALIAAGAIVTDEVVAKDDNGMLTWAEFKAHAEEGFTRLDVNHDGVIDQTDRQAMRDQMRNREFDGMDKNHDGNVSRQEFDSEHGHDGPPPPPGMAPPPGMGPDGDHHDGHRMGGPDGAGMAGGHRGGMGGMGGMMMLRGADTNHDSKITRAEYDASVKMHFNAMDANHDGQISPDERKAARDKMRTEMQGHMRERGGEMGGTHHGPDHGPEGDDMPPPAG